MGLEVKSEAFEAEETIPVKHTCDGEDVWMPLTWTGTPERTESLVIILEDVDSVKGIWSHWVLYGVPPDLDSLAEGVSPLELLPWGVLQGRNDFDTIGYGGPCPTDGKAHRYVVRLYALDRRLRLGPGATREEVLESMEGSIIDQAELMGRYLRLDDR